MANRLLVRIRTFDLETEKLEHERTVDFNDAEIKNWLLNHNLWALYNGKGVQICNERDWLKYGDTQ